MNSTSLKASRNAFINSVNDFSSKYQNIISQINKMNQHLNDSDDNFVYPFIVERNNEVISKINSLLSAVSSYKSATVEKVNRKIWELEQDEENEKNTKKDNKSK